MVTKIVKECKLPLTGQNSVSKIITELAVFEVNKDGLILTEISSHSSLDEVKEKTGCSFKISSKVKIY